MLTHSHADHIHGIDDIRPLVILNRRKIDLYMDAATSGIVRTAFGYIFETPTGSQYPALLNENRIISSYNVSIDGPGGTVDALPFQLVMAK